jgi:hypothetical protein
MKALRLISVILTAILVLPLPYSSTFSTGVTARSRTSTSPGPFGWGTNKVSYSSYENGGVNSSSLNNLTGVPLDDHDDLYVSDWGNNRKLYYPAITSSSTPSPSRPPRSGRACPSTGFIGRIIRVMPACGHVGDTVAVTLLSNNGAYGTAGACAIYDQTGYHLIESCHDSQTRQFRIAPTGGYFEVEQAFAKDESVFYCVSGTSFYTVEGYYHPNNQGQIAPTKCPSNSSSGSDPASTPPRHYYPADCDNVGGNFKWDLAHDFRTAPNQANPNPDSCGNQDVWYFMQGNGSASSTYRRLPEFISDTEHIVGLSQWQGTFVSTSVVDKLPAVGLNALGSTVRVRGITWPPGVIRVHPSPHQAVIVGWRSPVTGWVGVTGGVQDLDPTCGTGVTWSIDRGDATLATGSFPNGGAQLFQQGTGGGGLSRISVSRGTFLYTILDKNGPDDGCDSTGLSLQIHRASSEPSTPVHSLPPSNSNNISSPSSKPCSSPSFIGNITEITPACGYVGDTVTVTPLGFLLDCSISDQTSGQGFTQCGDPRHRVAKQFKIAPKGGYFLLTGNLPNPGFRESETVFYCVHDATFYTVAGYGFYGSIGSEGPSTHDLDRISPTTCPGKYGPPPPFRPGPRPPLRVLPERANCQTPDIQVNKATIHIHVGNPLDYRYHGGPNTIITSSLPYRYTGTVATFCDNDVHTSARTDYTASVVWTVSYSPGTKKHPGASLYGPNNQSDIDPSPRIYPIKGKPGEFAIHSSFLIQSLGHINIAVIVHKRTGVDGGGLASGASRVYVDMAPNDSDERAGAATGDAYLSDHTTDSGAGSSLQGNQYNPWFTVGFYNRIDTVYQIPPYETQAYDTPNGRRVFARGVVSALTSGAATTDFCDGLLSWMIDHSLDSDETSYDVVLANTIASNTSAADALLDCASPSQLQNYSRRSVGGVFGNETGREYLLWRIATSYFLDHLNDYAECDLSNNTINDNIVNYLCNNSLRSQNKNDFLSARVHLKVIAALATGMPGEQGAPTNESILERGMGLWIETNLPHPILCNPPCGNIDAIRESYWAAGTGRIFGTVYGGILGHIGDTISAHTKIANFEWGVAFWALGCAISVPTLWTGVPELAAYVSQSAFGLGTTYVATLVPPPDGNLYPAVDPSVGAAFDLASLLIESHSIYDHSGSGSHHTGRGVILANYPLPLEEQVRSVLDDGIHHLGPSYDCGRANRYYIVNQYLKEQYSYPDEVCNIVFNTIAGAYSASCGCQPSSTSAPNAMLTQTEVGQTTKGRVRSLPINRHLLSWVPLLSGGSTPLKSLTVRHLKTSRSASL